MIGNGHEACTYLQTYGHWKTAAVVAKVLYSPSIIYREVIYISNI